MRVPSLDTRGRFVLTSPFIAKSDVIYSVIALRELADIYLSGIDVYTTYYESAGLVNDVEVNGSVFSFDDESSLSPIIVTLEGTDGSLTYVPSTYIESFPNMGEVTYSRVVLSADVGALPDTVSVASILVDIEDLISSRFGVDATVKINRAFADVQPTSDEHEILEASRIGSISRSDNNYSEIIRLKNLLNLENLKVQSMTRMLVENNII